MLMLLAAYQLGWYGYATLQQPVPCSGSNQSNDNCADGCVGFMDLLMPGQINKVDACIAANWTGGSGTNIWGQQQGPGFQNPPTPITGNKSTKGGQAGCDSQGYLVDKNGRRQYDPNTGQALRCS